MNIQQHARAKRAKAEHVAAGRSGFAAYFGSADIQQQILRQVARAKRLERVLPSDPGMGVIRHADAGYELAKDCAQSEGVKIPML